MSGVTVEYECPCCSSRAVVNIKANAPHMSWCEECRNYLVIKPQIELGVSVHPQNASLRDIAEGKDTIERQIN